MIRDHLSMAELLTARDGDRSEPGFLAMADHLEGCPRCAAELEQLQQRTAHLRALPRLVPAVNVFPAVREQLHEIRVQRAWRRAVSVGMAAAAALVVWVVGTNLTHPTPLNAAQEIAEVKQSSRLLEERLEELNPGQRAMNGGTVIVVIGLKDRIAEVDQEIHRAEVRRPARAVPFLVRLKGQDLDAEQLQLELRLWRERERLMDALVKVHVNRGAQVEF